MSNVLLYLSGVKVVSYHPDPNSLTEAELSAGTLYEGDFPGFDADHDLEYHDGVVVKVGKPPMDPEEETTEEKITRLEALVTAQEEQLAVTQSVLDFIITNF